MNDKFYGVYYYKMTNSHFGALVYLAGYYKNKNLAISSLKKYITKPKKHINNTVVGNGYIGWINEYKYGDFKDAHL